MLHSILADVNGSYWMPERASTFAASTDWLFNFVMAICIFFFVLVTALLVYFAVRYRHRPGQPRPESTAGHSTALELTWTIIPTILVLVIYYYGFRQYLNLFVEPPNAYEITAVGKTWNWGFQYPNGHLDSELHVPVNTPVRMVLESEDVIHGLFIPSFRVKKDVVPGRYNRLWFEANQKGTYDIYCSQYCGTNHSTMRSKVVVEDPASFKAWLERVSNWEGRLSPIDAGKEFYTKLGCAQCHSVDGSRVIGPTWKDMFGSEVPLSDGRTVQADEAYVRESILYPNAKIVAGYQPVMPPFVLKERDINALISYMKSISGNFKGDLAPLKLVKPPAGGPTGGPATAPAVPATQPTVASAASAGK